MKTTITQSKFEESAVTVSTEAATNSDNVDLTIEWPEDEKVYLFNFPRHQLESLAILFTEVAKQEADLRVTETEGGLLQS